VSGEPADRPTVLVVEDEHDLADLYSDYLGDAFEVRLAYSGEEALEMLVEDLDVVLLDRRMPVVSGNEVLAAIEEGDLTCRVAMVTAVNPDFDIIDLRIDDYLVKPVTREEVLDTVDRLLTIDEYNERVQELTSKKLKRNVLEVEKTTSELADSEEFQRLSSQIEELEREVESIAENLDAENLQRYI